MDKAEHVDTATDDRRDSTAKRHAPLRLLFMIVNNPEPAPDETDRELGDLVMRYMEERGPDHAKFGGWPTVKRALEASTRAQSRRNTELLRHVIDSIMRLGADTGSPTLGFIRVPVAVRSDNAGKVAIGRPLVLDLLDALNGAEARRFGHCQVCSSYFYATRLLPSGKAPGACPAHTQALRQRRYRANQDRYEQTRKSKS